ncbi:hypothetical protein DOT35_08585 [Vibrio vulnificus]|nr:hypothetical protein DOT35_08585 [Vibrio vulnificus]
MRQMSIVVFSPASMHIKYTYYFNRIVIKNTLNINKEICVKKLALSKVFLLGLLASSYASANVLTGVVGIGYGFGGDKMGEGVFVNGDSDDIKANEGISIFGGADLALPQDFLLRGTLGYKFDTIDASNGDISFSRVPVEFTVFKSLSNHKLGAGFTYHTAVSYECNVSGICSGEVEFDDAAGLVVQYEYAFAPGALGQIAVGAKYTNIEYEVSSTGETFDGSGFDIHLTVLF